MKTHMTQPHGDDQTPAFLAHLIQVSSFNDALPPPVRCFTLRNAPLSLPLLPPKLCLSVSFKAALLFCSFLSCFSFHCTLVLSLALLPLPSQLQSWQFHTPTFSPLNLRGCISLPSLSRVRKAQSLLASADATGGSIKSAFFFVFET